MERLLKEKKENVKLAARLDSMEKLMTESAEQKAENEKLQEQLNQLKQKKSVSAATGAAAAAAASVNPPPQPTESPRRQSPRLRRMSHPRTKPSVRRPPKQSPPSTPVEVNL